MLKSLPVLAVAAVLSAACTSTSFPAPSTPEPQPSSPIPHGQIQRSDIQSWRFTFTDDVHSYSSVSRTIIQPLSNLQQSVDTFTTTSNFSVSIDRLQTPSPISGELSEINTVSSQRAHNQPLVTAGFSFTGTLMSGEIFLRPVSPSADTAICGGPAASSLGELHSALLSLPAQIQPGTHWTDTLTTSTCSGDRLPLAGKIIRSYEVEDISRQTGVTIKRTEEIHLLGTGSQLQHQIEVTAKGSGLSALLLNLETGILQTAQENQHLDIIIQTSGRTYHFRQEVTQQIKLTH